MLWETCRQAKAWQDDGYRPGLVAVNISAIQLQDSGFVAAVREILAAMEAAAKTGQGATTYKGRLIDLASIKQAEVIVKQAEMIGA